MTSHENETSQNHIPKRQKTFLRSRRLRYLAVPTVRSKQTSPKAKEVLMIWNIPRESLVGQNVYELNTAPAVGEVASYDKLRAEYIGNGPTTL